RRLERHRTGLSAARPGFGLRRSDAVNLRPLFEWVRAERVPTPVHVCCPPAVVEAATRLRAQLPGRISYATKANIHPLMLSTVDPVVDDFNVTNRVHLEAVLAAGVDPDRIVY